MSKEFFSILIIFLFGVVKSSTDHDAKDILSYMDKYLDTHASKSYYMTIDPDGLLDEIDHKMLAKYQNIIFDNYGIITLIIVARGLKGGERDLNNFKKNFYKEFEKTVKMKDLRCVVSIITVNNMKLIVDSTSKIKYIFNDRVLSALTDKMKVTFYQNHLFLSIYELLKNVEKAQKQFSAKGAVTDL